MQNSGNVPEAKIEVKNFGELENFQRKYFRFLLHSNKIWICFQKGLVGVFWLFGPKNVVIIFLLIIL